MSLSVGPVGNGVRGPSRCGPGEDGDGRPHGEEAAAGAAAPGPLGRGCACASALGAWLGLPWPPAATA